MSRIRRNRISNRRLANAFVKAQEIAEKEKEQKEKEEIEKRIKEVGIKDCKTRFGTFFNRLHATIKILAFPKKYMNDNMGITMIMAMILSMLFKLTEYLLYIIPFVVLCFKIDNRISWNYASIICLIFIGVVLGRLFRMASIEIEDQANDKRYVISIFTCVFSVITFFIGYFIKK